MIKGWEYSNERKCLLKRSKKPNEEFGYVYAIRIEVAQGFSLLKIGATRNPKDRFLNFSKCKATLFCISPPHRNFWENEEILHNTFAKYRVPSRPEKGVQAEFFNLSMPYFLSHLPELFYKK